MDPSTITLIVGVVSCGIGVSTFVSSLITKSERNGSMETKINQALKGIEAINQKLESSSNEQHNIDLLVRSHEEKIKTLFTRERELKEALDESKETREVLIELLQTVRSLHGGNHET